MRLKDIQSGEVYLVQDYKPLRGSKPITHFSQVRVISKSKGHPGGSVLAQVVHLSSPSWSIPHVLHGCALGAELRLSPQELAVSKSEYQGLRREFSAREQRHKQEAAALKRESLALPDILDLPAKRVSTHVRMPSTASGKPPEILVTLTLDQSGLAALMARLERIGAEPASALASFFPEEEQGE